MGRGVVLPDTITLFRSTIEAAAGDDPAALRREIVHTVVHEVAHHFGISDER
ncbi:MAG: metallopeptidase family protein, partial [Actinomycetota bacterium]